MKKVLLVLALALVAFTAKAQLYVGGSIAFDTVGGFNINLAPEVGYNLNDDMAVGLAVGLGFGGGTTVAATPYFRYYFLDWGPAILFADAQFTYQYANYGGGATANSWGIGICPGIAVPVGGGFSVVTHFARLGYYGGAFGLSFNRGASIGVYYEF